MSHPLKRVVAALAGAGLCTLAACGGGGGSSSASGSADQAPAAGTPVADAPTTTPTVTTPKSVTLSGIAATGAALSGATIKVYDSTGAVVCSTVAGSAGDYSCDLGTAPKAPFVVTASLDDTSLVSMFAEAVSSTVNVTPVTNLIAARLASNGDPAQLIADIQSAPAAVDKTKLENAVNEVLAMLKPVLDALNEKTNPLTGNFAADGTGHDKLLDALQITVRPAGAASNIEITVKTQPSADDAAPVKLSFTSSDASVAPISATISANDLGGDNVAVLIADALRRMTDCYALPVAERVSNGANPGSAIQADACKSLFLSNDPSTFLNNGATVGPNGAFSGVFRSGGDGTSFDRGNFEFYRANGDVVFSYRWTTPAGGTDNEQVVARKVNGALKLVGNGYQYDARVRAYMQHRELLNSPAYNHVDVGYNVSVANRLDGQGNPLFAKVLVTTPRGNVLTLKPTAGLGYLGLVNASNQIVGTSVIRLNGRYIDPNTAGHPKDKESSLFYADPTQNSDDVIRAIPDQGVWKLEFFHADVNLPNVIQTYRTSSRAPTLAEAMMTPVVELTADTKADWISQTSATGTFVYGAAGGLTPNFARIVGPNNADAWRVPSGALAPVSVNVYGRAAPSGGVPGARFNDGISVSTLARKAVISCSRASNADTHCDASYQTQYVQGATINSIELWARNARQVEVSKMLGVYKIN